MGIVKQKNPKTGVVYVYPNEAYGDKEKTEQGQKETDWQDRPGNK